MVIGSSIGKWLYFPQLHIEALTIHSLIDYRMDMLTAGIIHEFGEDGKSVLKNIRDFMNILARKPLPT
ncbi:MAG: hypothetical protein K5877_00295 [Lachnospiraceae bacterium]|nr:hypothetical protein [Lachnospiraceae bacterium]